MILAGNVFLAQKIVLDVKPLFIWLLHLAQNIEFEHICFVYCFYVK